MEEDEMWDGERRGGRSHWRSLRQGRGKERRQKTLEEAKTGTLKAGGIGGG